MDRIARIFELYRELRANADLFISKRDKGQFGILVNDDEYAMRYRAIRWPLELCESFLENRKPRYFRNPNLTQGQIYSKTKEEFNGWRDR